MLQCKPSTRTSTHWTRQFLEHRNALGRRKPVSAYAAWDLPDNDPMEVWRSQTPHTPGCPEAQGVQAQLAALNKRIDDLAMMLEKQAKLNVPSQAQNPSPPTTAASGSRGHPLRSRSPSPNRGACHNCHQFGHWKSNCPQLKQRSSSPSFRPQGQPLNGPGKDQ